MKQFIILFLWYLVSKIFGIKNWIIVLGIVAPILGCSKEKIIENGTVKVYDCMAITYVLKENGDTIIHWHKVCDGELYRFMSYPKESVIDPNCDSRIQVLIISPDKCKN